MYGHVNMHSNLAASTNINMATAMIAGLLSPQTKPGNTARLRT